MNTSVPEPKAAHWLILVGGCFFILVLAVSAYWEADIRWLHFFQAWMYIAAIVLALRRYAWGYWILTTGFLALDMFCSSLEILACSAGCCIHTCREEPWTVFA